jgi:hypothetical protein
LKSIQDNGSCPIEELGEKQDVGPKMHQYLLNVYFTEIHPLYPFLDTSPVFLSAHEDPSRKLHPSEEFILQMVYSVACQCATGRGNQLLLLSDACHSRALEHIDIATANLTMITLQAIALLALRSLFDPKKGNFGQLITVGARLAVSQYSVKYRCLLEGLT